MLKFILIITTFLIPTFNFSLERIDTVISNNENKIPFLLEPEEPLQKNPESSLETVLTNFLAKGGVIYQLEGLSQPFKFLPGDYVFPACSAGFNRSQTVWALMKPYAEIIHLHSPHATRYGFDPYNNEANWIRSQNMRPPAFDEFMLWTGGIPKHTRLGWDIFANWLSECEASQDDLKMMREYYDNEYYHPAVSSETRRIYITFAKNAHVHMYRLTQVNDNLENVIILFYPLEDLIQSPLPEWYTVPRSKKAYKKFSRILLRHLDFETLKF